ncbi:unnamed protein product [Protopolystoma xenopodis]|uniref:Uncharacterized protein n=1 Tax=Protopolystoma xenopodis TaxID=117903 RepID=A0A3S5A0F3_9PLAT|nr:unnamed protein product [Protopolystoma xenopodis]
MPQPTARSNHFLGSFIVLSRLHSHPFNHSSRLRPPLGDAEDQLYVPTGQSSRKGRRASHCPYNWAILFKQ